MVFQIRRPWNMSKSWHRVLSARRHAIAESDSSTEGYKEKLLTKSFSNPESASICSNCCATCQATDKQRPKSKQNLLTSRSDSKIEHKQTPYKEQVEMKVLNDEMNEQVSHEKYSMNQKLVEDLTRLLRSISIYVHSIDLRHKAGERVQNQLSEMLTNDDLHHADRITSSWITHSNKLHEILCCCNENIEIPDNYYESLDDYKDKYRDYTKASSNFCKILGEDVMSNTQIRKLELQYEEIRLNYTNSKANIASHFNNIITKRSEVVETCIQALLPILNQVMEEDRFINDFLRSISFAAIKFEKDSSSKSLSEKTCIRRKSVTEKSCNCSHESR